jgi:hypothetical protein
MFLSTVILGPNSPGRNIYICLRLLIDELKQFWLFGALTYDVLRKHNFVVTNIGGSVRFACEVDGKIIFNNIYFLFIVFL